MKYLTAYKLFESALKDYEELIGWKLIDLTDIGLSLTIKSFNKYIGPELITFIEIYITRKGEPREISDAPTPPGGYYPGDIFLWREVKESILDLLEWYYYEFKPEDMPKKVFQVYSYQQQYLMKSPIKFFNGGTNFLSYWNDKEDLFNKIENIGDLISFTSLKIELKIKEEICPIKESISIERDYGYREFSDKFIQDLEFCCYDFIDEGYNVWIHEVKYFKSDSPTKPSIAIDVDTNNFIEFDTFKRTILEIESLSKSNGFNVDIEVKSEDEFLNVKDFTTNYAGEEFSDLAILIY